MTILVARTTAIKVLAFYSQVSFNRRIASAPEPASTRPRGLLVSTAVPAWIQALQVGLGVRASPPPGRCEWPRPAAPSCQCRSLALADPEIPDAPERQCRGIGAPAGFSRFRPNRDSRFPGSRDPDRDQTGVPDFPNLNPSPGPSDGLHARGLIRVMVPRSRGAVPPRRPGPGMHPS